MNPTSRFRAARARPARGFTLIEILVVIIIVGVIVTFATLSIGNRALSDRLENEAQRLQQLFAMASEDAEMHGTEIGFIYTNQGYAFVAVGLSGRWTPIMDGPLRPREVKAPITLTLRVEGRPIAPTPVADVLAAAQVAIAAAEKESGKSSSDKSGDQSKNIGGLTVGSNDKDSDKKDQSDKKDTEALKPQVLFLSSGEATALAIDVAAPGVPEAYRLEIDNLGRAKMTTLGGGRK